LLSVRDPIDQVLDVACGLYFDRDHKAKALTRLHVSAEAYEAIRRAREKEIARGMPLVVLDLDLVVDEELSGSQARVS
jgi:hypothetical protein